MSRPASGKPPDPPAEGPGLVAPTTEAWAAMSAAKRERFLLAVIDAHSDPEEARAATLLASVREGIFLLLAARQIAIPDEIQAAVRACADPAALTEMLRRAATVTDPRALLPG